jgi:hypothetical protein
VKFVKFVEFFFFGVWCGLIFGVFVVVVVVVESKGLRACLLAFFTCLVCHLFCCLLS